MYIHICALQFPGGEQADLASRVRLLHVCLSCSPRLAELISGST